MTAPKPKTFVQQVAAFRKSASPWLTDDDDLGLAMLDRMASELDDHFAAATMAQFSMMYRDLMKKRPAASGEVDPLAQALADANR